MTPHMRIIYKMGKNEMCVCISYMYVFMYQPANQPTNRTAHITIYLEFPKH